MSIHIFIYIQLHKLIERHMALCMESLVYDVLAVVLMVLLHHIYTHICSIYIYLSCSCHVKEDMKW